MSSAPKYFCVTVSILPTKKGIDLPRSLQQINGLLEDYSTATHVIYKFKVTGEPKIISVIQVSNVLGFERTIGGLSRLGNLEVVCSPIIGYESFAQYLGVDASLISQPPRPLPKENLYWLSFDLAYTGKSTDEFLLAWKREAQFVMNARSKDGFTIELFKVLCERKVHAFLQVADPVQLDQLSFNLPIMQENGQNVTLRCQAIQYLPDYCQRIYSEAL